MTPNDLIQLFREEADDIDPGFESDLLWKDRQVIGYLNDALQEALRRVPKLFVSSSVTGVTDIAVTQGNSSYALDARVQYIRSARLSGIPGELIKKMSVDDIAYESGDPSWATKTGTPIWFHETIHPHSVNLYPIPDTAATLTIEASLFYPEITETTRTTTLPFPLEYQRGLIHWMLHRAYSVKDGQTFDPKLASVYDQKFTQVFGPQKSAMVLENMRRYRNSDARSRASWR